jgi:catechol 2,3-dioxygenase-like lactoylglutathione lyase family enzyme
MGGGMDKVWNLGVKVRDLNTELAFLKACGATGIEKGANRTPDGELGFGMAFLGSQRLLLFPKVIYEGALTAPLKHGIAHAVYQVGDVASVLERLRANGVSPLWGPEEVATPFGRRRIVFFRSPSGFIFETFQHLG